MSIQPTNLRNFNIENRFPEIHSKMVINIEEHPEKSLLYKTALKQLESIQQFDNNARITNINNPLRHLINTSTVLLGTQKDWDPIRLLAGKHVELSEIGAEHIQLTSKVGDKIDAVHLSVKNFINKIEEAGGQKGIFQTNFEPSQLNPYGAQEVKLKAKNSDRSIQSLKLGVEELKNIKLDELIKFYHAIGFEGYPDVSTGDVYFLNKEDFTKFTTNGNQLGERFTHFFRNAPYDIYTFSSSLENVHILPASKDSNKDGIPNLDKVNAPFEGFYFENHNPKLKEHLEKCEIGRTPWEYIEVGDHAYLVKKSNVNKIKLSHNLDVSLQKTDTLPITKQEGPTVLLTMNQMEIYEQYTREMLTFLLEGVNVMAYNNGGKGLSTGNAERINIESAIEVSYQYLKQVKNIPDDKILAKGQCFGGAPSAWLGKQYPNINLMIDQAPANFHEVANDSINQLTESETLRKIGASATKALLLDFNLAEDLKANRGNILLNIDTPNELGWGGDDVVPAHHPAQLIDSLAMLKGKKYELSVNQGAGHVSDWFSNEKSYRATVNFLKQSKLISDLFKPDITTDQAKTIAINWHAKCKKALAESDRLIALQSTPKNSENASFKLTVENQIQSNNQLLKELIAFTEKLSFSLENSPDAHVKSTFEKFVVNPLQQEKMALEKSVILLSAIGK